MSNPHCIRCAHELLHDVVRLGKIGICPKCGEPDPARPRPIHAYPRQSRPFLFAWILWIAFFICWVEFFVRPASTGEGAIGVLFFSPIVPAIATAFALAAALASIRARRALQEEQLAPSRSLIWHTFTLIATGVAGMVLSVLLAHYSRRF